MSTIGYQLNILRDTQMVQRRLLEKQFPYIDWARMPFSSYGDFFRLRGILDDCGAVWTNAYGRSNGEAESTRKYLEDYSGNGRDIELFNFGYSRQSGYNGYVYGMNSFSIPESVTGNATESSISVTNTMESGTYSASYYNVPTELKRKSWKVFVEKEDDVNVQIAWFNSNYSKTKAIPLNNGLNTIPGLTEEESSVYLSMAIALPQGKSVKITEIPSYRGAIVGDGVDDYGQCVKDFALPDDYTVVAMRELLNAGPSGIINKTRATGEGAFIFEYGGSQSYSYGDNYSGLTTPKLFSYQTKASYNGTVLTPGTGADTADDKLLIFRLRDGTSNYISAALYSLGIFTRTLTEEELRIVENCMYAEWIAMTGKLEDIEYYDILDARFRSNEEAEDKRNRWVGRLGKLHMTLNNYAYSQMSGWGGFRFDWSGWASEINSNGGEVVREKNKITVKNFGEQPEWAIISRSTSALGGTLPAFTVRVSGLKEGATLRFSASGKSNMLLVHSDGIYSIPEDSSNPTYYGFAAAGYSVNEEANLVIEQLPVYPGALVSDGVDDNAVSDEVIDEEIGGFVWHGELLTEGYAFATHWGANHVFLYKGGKVIYYGGTTSSGVETIINKPVQILGFLRAPAIPNNNLMITPKLGSTYDYLNAALYQLRLIKNQPTDVQLEAIKWQCRKEHDDYLIHMGWKEVE